MRRSIRSAFVAALILLLPVANALPDPVTYDATPHDGADYPAGWCDVDLPGPASSPFRLHYPAMEEGEDATMAGNGPFTIALFLPDDGEGSSDYDLLAGAMAARGQVVAVLDERPEDVTGLERVLSRIQSIGEGDGTVPGALNGFSTHWVLGGHGFGAQSALLLSSSWADEVQETEAPAAVFGLGLQDDGLLIEEGVPTTKAKALRWSGMQVALLVTGSVDGIAPVEDHALPLLDEKVHLGVHVMTLRGANHHQWKDETGFLEFGDGDATLSREEQIAYGVEHVVGLMDFSTRGALQAFHVGFNRAADGLTVSDPEAYLDEALLHSRLLRFELLGPAAFTSHGMGGSVDVTAEVGLWDGSNWSEDGRSATAECEVVDASLQAEGTVDEDGRVACSLDPSSLSPGPFEVLVTVRIDGVPVHALVPLLRSNGALSPVLPLPVVHVPQGGEASLLASELATDPDGTEVRFTAARSTGAEAERFRVELEDEGRSLRVLDNSAEDWVGTVMLNLSLEAVGDTRPLILEIEAVMDPVDNRVTVLASPSTVILTEDGESAVFNASEYAQDPEGAALVLTFGNGSNFQVAGPVEVRVLNESLVLTPRPEAFGSTLVELMVGDGTTAPVALDLPVVVEAVDDPLQWNTTTLLLELSEDVPLSVDLSTMGWDPDGASVGFEVLHLPPDQDLMTVSQVGTVLTLVPLANAYGQTSFTLRMSSGENALTMVVPVLVNPVEDAGSIRLVESSTVDGVQLSVKWTVVDPDDLEGTVFDSTVHDADGRPLDLVGSVMCGPPLIDSTGSTPAWAVTCDGLWSLSGIRLDGLVLRVVEVRPDLEQDPTYVLPLTVDAAPAEQGDDAAESFAFGRTVGLAVVVLVLLVGGLMMMGRDGPPPPRQEDDGASQGLLARAAGARQE